MFQQARKAVPYQQLVQLAGAIAADLGGAYKIAVGHGLGQELIRPFCHGFELNLLILLRRQVDDRQAYPFGIKTDQLCHRGSGISSHANVQQHYVG